MPMGEKGALICHDCFKSEAANEIFDRFAAKHGIDINNLTGKEVTSLVLKSVATILAKASLFGIKVRKIEMADITDDIGAMAAETNFEEFDNEFLPKLRAAATGDLPDHVKAAVEQLGSSIGKFNA